MRAALSRQSGRGSHWKATPISIEFSTRMSIANMDASDAAVIAVQHLYGRRRHLDGMRDLRRELNTPRSGLALGLKMKFRIRLDEERALRQVLEGVAAQLSQSPSVSIRVRKREQ